MQAIANILLAAGYVIACMAVLCLPIYVSYKKDRTECRH